MGTAFLGVWEAAARLQAGAGGSPGARPGAPSLCPCCHLRSLSAAAIKTGGAGIRGGRCLLQQKGAGGCRAQILCGDPCAVEMRTLPPKRVWGVPALQERLTPTLCEGTLPCRLTLGWCSTLWGWGPCPETPVYFPSGQMVLPRESGLQEIMV